MLIKGLAECHNKISTSTGPSDFQVHKMEAEVTWNHSSTDFSGFSNSFNTTTEFSFGEESFKWTSEEIARLIQITIRTNTDNAGDSRKWFNTIHHVKNFTEGYIKLFLHGCFSSSRYT